MNYAQANEKLTGRCKDSRKLENNTYLKRRGQDIVVRLHSTDVVTYHPNGDISLASGGWNTITTKSRINTYSPFQLQCERGEPFLYLGRGLQVPFVDGITVKPSGEIVNGSKQTIDDIRAEWHERDRESARISRWKSKARGLTRDSSQCTKQETNWRYRADDPNAPKKCGCWRCGRRGFGPSKLSPGKCTNCGCLGVVTRPNCPKLTPAKIQAESKATARRAMILCYGLARYLQDAGVVIEQSPEYTFLRAEIDRWNAVTGMKDAEGNIIVTGGQCRSLEDARAWFAKTAADALVNRGQGTTEDIVRTELLRSL